MSEPEEVIIDAARFATEAVGGLWQRFDGGREKARGAFLGEQRKRLELFLAGLHQRPIPIRMARTPTPPTPLWRLFHRMPRWLVETRALPATDGSSVFLPAQLLDQGGVAAATRYKVLAVQQAGRLLRGTALLPELPAGGIARALYQMCEAAAVDRQIAGDFPGLSADLVAVRRDALATRPERSDRSASEAAVETIYRGLLSSPLTGVSDVPAATSRADSWRWAEETAARIERDCADRFRAMCSDLWLGLLLPPAAQRQQAVLEAGPEPQAEDDRPSSVRLPKRPQVREQDEDEQDEDPGPLSLGLEQFQEHAEDPMGMQRPIDRGAGEESEGSADSVADLEETAVVATPERAKEIFLADDPTDAGARLEALQVAKGIRYPEWDHRIGGYHHHGATVRLQPTLLGDPAWAARVLERRRHLFHAVRRRFEGLQPRRIQLRRQTDGEDVDLDAWVEAHADLHAGKNLPERVYALTRPRRRDLAIEVLVDVSGSTDAWVSEDLRIIDVEKEALLVCCHALDVLGDPYAIQAFSGEGPHGVAVWRVKDYEERDPTLVQRRIASLEPDRHTRAGAALRHATAQLARRREHHRLLLLLSDGKPNDVDVYEGRYGVEDMRQAIVEARATGIHAFCLTIDRAAPRYVPRIFGTGGHATLAHARELPTALVEVLRRLVTS